MKHAFLIGTVFAAVSITTAAAGIVGHTFTGVTIQTPIAPIPHMPEDLIAEFPHGTKWTLRVEWDDASAPLPGSGYRLTKMTLTLQGKNGEWTTSSLPDKALLGLGKWANEDEMQFTSGGNPEDHTIQTIGSKETRSVNLVLQDPTRTAIASTTSAPRAIDLKKWDLSPLKSYLKFYLDNSANQYIYGRIDSTAAEPDISVSQPRGKNLRDGKSTVSFGRAKVGKKGGTKTFAIRNDGGAALEKLAVKVSGKARKDFVARSPSKKKLAPGGSATVKVRFQPKTAGKRAAQLKILSNDPDERSFDIKLAGKGVAP